MAPPVVTALNALVPPEGQGVRGQVRSRPLHSALDALVAYVPLALMVGLAGASFWLLRVTPTFEVSAPSAVRSNVPDDYLVNFVSRSFNEAGQLTAEVFGDTGTHVPATGNMLITNPRIRSWGDGAAITVGRAKRALIDDGQTVYELTGNAVVTHIRPDREQVVIEGEHLRMDTGTDILRALTPSRVTSGKDVVTGDSMVFQNVTGITEWQGHVRAVFQPRTQ